MCTLLVALLPRLVAPGGQALLADPGRPALEAFLAALAGGGWTVESGAPAAAGGRAVVYRLVPPGA